MFGKWFKNPTIINYDTYQPPDVSDMDVSQALDPNLVDDHTFQRFRQQQIEQDEELRRQQQISSRNTTTSLVAGTSLPQIHGTSTTSQNQTSSASTTTLPQINPRGGTQNKAAETPKQARTYNWQGKWNSVDSLPPIKTPIFHREGPMFKWVKKWRIPKAAFEELVEGSVLRDSLFVVPKSTNQRLIGLDSWKRVQDLSKCLNTPKPCGHVNGHPIYGIKDYISILASTKAFWQHLIVSPDYREPESNPKKRIVDDFVQSSRFQELTNFAQSKGAKVLLLDLFIDGFEMERFSTDNSLCGIYLWISNYNTPILSQVEDYFLGALFPEGENHNLYLLSIFQQFNELFNGIELYNMVSKKKEKYIVLLNNMIADTPERAKITCHIGHQGGKGCIHCDLDLILNNILRTVVGDD